MQVTEDVPKMKRSRLKFVDLAWEQWKAPAFRQVILIEWTPSLRPDCSNEKGPFGKPIFMKRPTGRQKISIIEGITMLPCVVPLWIDMLRSGPPRIYLPLHSRVWARRVPNRCRIYEVGSCAFAHIIFPSCLIHPTLQTPLCHTVASAGLIYQQMDFRL